MASKINYNNKAPFQTLEEIPDENKVNAADMNEIKQVVNTNADELDTAKENIESLQNGQGTSNADITNLKNRVSTLETDNSTNKTDISSLKTEQEEQNNRLNILEEDNTTNKQDISSIKSEQTEQDKQIDILLNALPSETQEAENINIKGTIPVKFKEFKVSGNSKQDTREGKNLTNYKDWTITGSVEEITKQEDDEIVCEIPANNAYGIKDIERTLKPNTAYTACVDYEFSQTLTSNCGLRVAYNGNYTAFNRKGIITFTTDETGLARMQFYVGMPYSGEAGTLTVKNIRLYEGTYTSETIPEYEEYGAMPSPEFPSPIQNVEGDVNVTVTNKNLFTGLVKGISVNSMGEVVEKDTGSVSNFIKVDFDKNSRYYLSGLTDTLNSYVSFYNKDKQYLGRTAGDPRSFISFGANSFSTKVENYEDIEDKNIKFIKVSQYEIDTSIGTIDDIDNLQVQLETGSTSTAYVPHKQQTVTFPLAEGKLYKGDYLADDGIHHVRKQRELDGTEYWFVSGICYYISISDKKLRYELTKGKMLCNYFKETIASNSAEAKIGEFFEAFYSAGNRNVMFNYDNGEGGVDNFKSYLSQQKQAGTPVILEYELAEEEIEAYTSEQQEAYNQLKQLTAYDEETNVYSTNEVNPVFTVTAVKDINSVITQLNTVLLERS